MCTRMLHAQEKLSGCSVKHKHSLVFNGYEREILLIYVFGVSLENILVIDVKGHLTVIKHNLCSWNETEAEK